MRASILASTLLLFVMAVPAFGQKATKKEFQEYCKLNQGRWIGDVTWVADWPGFGTKGEKVTGYFVAEMAEDGNAMAIRFFGGNGSATGLCYYDAGAKEIKFVWVHSSGFVTHNNAYKKDGKWIEAGTGTLPDGTKTAAISTLTMSDGGKTMTATGSGTVGGEKTDDQHDVWRRVSNASTSAVRAKPSGEIPKKAREALSFFVADWEAESYDGDKKVATSVDRRAWAPGQHCLTLDWSGTTDGVPWRASGIAGWDAKADAIIEYWHGSFGQSLVVCYPLDKMTPTVWEGTSRFTAADGTSSEGPCRLTKTPVGYEYVAPSKHDGKETIYRSVARRLKGKQSAVEAVKAADAKPENIPEKAMAAMKYFAGVWKGEGEGGSDGVEVTGHDRRYWVPGAHALRIEWSGAHDGIPSQFSGLAGWDPKTKALVEHWFGSRGQVNNNSYPVDRMKGNVWQGTFSFVMPDGQYVEGKSTFTANPEEGIWVGRSTQDGKETVYKSVARKVKQ
ncbi:MAG: hypothetical protein ACOX1P_04025 [Thermoguttaceae bacterium]|jgi:hypothetical protein